VEFRILGPVELWTAETEHDLGSAKQRCLLAALLLAAGRPVSAETLIERVWGESAPAEVRQSLHSDISHLRKRLRSVGDRVRLRAVSHTYVLDVDPQSVDLYRSNTLHLQGSSLAKSGEYTEASRLLHSAEALWRAEPLAGLTGTWVERTRAALDSDYRGLATELVDLNLKLGLHSEIVSFLLDLNGRYPLDEEFVARLMIAYYRCGRQTDAIGLYMETARRLKTEMGLQPGPRLQELHHGILAHDPSLRFSRDIRKADASRESTLPAAIPEFVGRSAELTALTGQARPRGGAIVISGMPGVGKTSLAVKVAHELTDDFPDAQIYLDLRAHDPERPPLAPAAALSALLLAVGVEPKRIPRALSDRARLWRDEMTGRRVLVVLDDASDREQVRPLLPASPDCQVVITSRCGLDGLDGVQRRRLPVLPLDEAATLFTRVAGEVLDLPAAQVIEVVRLCGRLPLPIRFAATRLRDRRTRSLEELIEQLREIGTGIEDGQPAELITGFGLSYRDLTERQRSVFRKLGISPVAEFTAANVAALVDTPPAAAGHVLSELTHHSLLVEVAPGRFRCHDLILRYARGRSIREDTEQDRRRAIGRTLDHYLTRAEHADRLLQPHRHRELLTRLDASKRSQIFGTTDEADEWFAAEWRNLSALVHYCADHEWNRHAIDLADLVARFFDVAGHWEEIKAIHRRALKIGLDLGLPSAVAQARLNLAIIQWRMGDSERAYKEALLARDGFRRIPDPAKEAAALDRLGLILWTLSDYRAALAFFGEAYDVYHEIGDRDGEADCLGHAGMSMLRTGRYREAIETFESALGIYRSLRDLRGEAVVLNNIGDAKLLLGYYREATGFYRASQQIYDSIGGRRNIAILLINFGDVARYRGDTRTALSLYRQAAAEFAATGDRFNEANVLNNIGLALSADDRFSESLGHHRRALAIAEEIGNTYEKTRAMLGSADAEAGSGRYSLAQDVYETARSLARDIGDPNLEALALCGLGEAARHLEGADAARIYWRQAENIFRQLGNPHALSSVHVRLQALDFAAPKPWRRFQLAGQTGENRVF
jgi:DNA-binding SARP family transcriptional activator